MYSPDAGASSSTNNLRLRLSKSRFAQSPLYRERTSRRQNWRVFAVPRKSRPLHSSWRWPTLTLVPPNLRNSSAGCPHVPPQAAAPRRFWCPPSLWRLCLDCARDFPGRNSVEFASRVPPLMLQVLSTARLGAVLALGRAFPRTTGGVHVHSGAGYSWSGGGLSPVLAATESRHRMYCCRNCVLTATALVEVGVV